MSDKNEEAKAAMMAEFSHYDKKILRLFEYVYECQTYKVLNRFGLLTGYRLAENVKRWPLYIHDPYPTWVKGRIVLIGDAAHPVSCNLCVENCFS